MTTLLLAALFGSEPDLGSIAPEHLREVVARADMDRYPTPPAGTRVPSLLMQRRPGFGGGSRQHWWKPRP